MFGTTSVYGNRDDSYCSFPFSFILKIISPRLISVLFKKCVIPNYIEFSKKSKKNWEICLVPKILQGGKYTLNPAFNY